LHDRNSLEPKRKLTPSHEIPGVLAILTEPNMPQSTQLLARSPVAALASLDLDVSQATLRMGYHGSSPDGKLRRQLCPAKRRHADNGLHTCHPMVMDWAPKLASPLRLYRCHTHIQPKLVGPLPLRRALAQRQARRARSEEEACGGMRLATLNALSIFYKYGGVDVSSRA
jgi:hypothetical protein